MLKKLFSALFGRKKETVQTSDPILIIEDSPTDRTLIERILINSNFKTLVACDGQTGLDIARKHLPSLILLDYELPDFKGPEICHRLKEDEGTKDIPVIFITGNDSPQGIIEGYEEGADNYLVKPISPSLLRSQVIASLEDHTKD